MILNRTMLGLAVASYGFLAASGFASAPSQNPICIDRFDEAATLIDELAETVNPAHDLEELLFSMAFDAESVVEFVTNSVRFEPYAGTLKGARGTLSARAGNALDQSLLLATLLKDAGADARIARAILPEEFAIPLARAALQNPEPVPLTGNPKRFEAAVSAIADKIGRREAPPIESEGLARVPSQQAVEIARQLAKTVSMLDRTDELRRALQDYFFVEWRIGPGDSWQAAHPAFGSEPAPTTLSPTEYFGSSIPDELQHRIRFEIGIETLEAGKIQQKLVASPWERPAANFFDASISWGIMPLEQNREGSDAATSLFIPTFGGQLAPGAMAFNMLGQTVDPQDASNPAAGVVATVGRRFLDAATAVTDNPEDQPLMALTGQFIRVSWISPDGRTRTEERWFLDRLLNRGAAGQPPRVDPSATERQVADALSFLRTYMVQPAGEHLPWTLKRSLEATSARLKWSADMLRMLDWETGRLKLEPSKVERWSGDQPVLLKLASLVHQPLALPAGETAWRDGPFIVALHQTHDSSNESRQWLDIHFNAWRGLGITEDKIESRPDLAILRGVLDTFWEGVVAGRPDAYRAPVGEHIQTPGNRRQQLDIEQGFMLAEIETGDAESTWWRIHPETGEILGMQTIGGGIEFEEYLGVTMVGISAFLIGRSMGNCSTIEDTSKRRCCYAVAVVFGLSSGAGIGAALVASPIGMTVGAAMAMGVLQLKAMLVLDYAQGVATEAACD